MRVLGLTDGSVMASAALKPFDGLITLDTHILPNPLPHALRKCDLVVISLSHFHGNSLNKMVGWLLAHRIESVPRILCLPPDDLARLAGELRASNTQVLALPVDPAALLDLVEKFDSRFAKIRKMPRRKSAAAVSALSRSFGGMIGAKDVDPIELVTAIALATEEVCTALDTDGLGDWLTTVASYHSYTARHCMAVAGFAAQWSRNLGVDQADHELFTRGALLHDIGKMSVPLAILDKPGKLTDEERLIIQSHPGESKRILEASSEADPVVIELAYAHHELLDGSGYPEKLMGAQINDMVRCITIIDIYSALVDTRSYKKAFTPIEAFDILRSMEGKLDQDLVRVFRPVVDAHAQQLLANPPAAAAA